MTTRTARFAMLLAIVAASGCGKPSQPAQVRAVATKLNMERASSKEIREFTATSGVIAGAKAGQAMLPPVPMPTLRTVQQEIVIVPKAPVASSTIRVHVKSEKPYTRKEAAFTDALTVARIEVMKQLEMLDPPVHARPSMVAMRNDYLRKDSVVEKNPTDSERAEWVANKLDPNRVWVEVDIELNDYQIQQLRSSERVNIGFRVGGVIFVMALAISGFLRLDEWTRGYLTVWLAVGAFTIVGIAIAAVLYTVRGGN